MFLLSELALNLGPSLGASPGPNRIWWEMREGERKTMGKTAIYTTKQGSGTRLNRLFQFML